MDIVDNYKATNEDLTGEIFDYFGTPRDSNEFAEAIMMNKTAGDSMNAFKRKKTMKKSGFIKTLKPSETTVNSPMASGYTTRQMFKQRSNSNSLVTGDPLAFNSTFTAQRPSAVAGANFTGVGGNHFMNKLSSSVGSSNARLSQHQRS